MPLVYVALICGQLLAACFFDESVAQNSALAGGLNHDQS